MFKAAELKERLLAPSDEMLELSSTIGRKVEEVGTHIKQFFRTTRGQTGAQKLLLRWVDKHAVNMFDRRLAAINAQMVVLALCGALFVIITNEVCFEDDQLYFRELKDCPDGRILSFLGWICSLLLLWRLFVYYRVQALAKALRWDFPHKWDAFKQSSLKWKFLAEFIIGLMQPVPYLSDLWVFGHKLVLAMMFLRLYLVVRLARDFSPVYRKRQQLANQLTVIDKNHFTVDAYSVLKILFYEYSVLAVCGLFLGVLVFFSYSMYILERAYWVPISSDSGLNAFVRTTLDHPVDHTLYEPSQFSSFYNSAWFVVVTMTTLGYGDMVPVGWEGRLVAIADVLIGICITSLIVGVVTNKLAPTPFQRFVITWVRVQEVNTKKERYAALIILEAWRFHKEQRRKRIPGMVRGHTFRHITSEADSHTILLPRIRRFVQQLRRLKRQELEIKGDDADFSELWDAQQRMQVENALKRSALKSAPVVVEEPDGVFPTIDQMNGTSTTAAPSSASSSEVGLLRQENVQLRQQQEVMMAKLTALENTLHRVLRAVEKTDKVE